MFLLAPSFALLFFSFEGALFFLFFYGGLFIFRPLFALPFFFSALLSMGPIGGGELDLFLYTKDFDENMYSSYFY